MDAIPVALRPLVRRLETIPDLSRKDLISVLFVVRLGDKLHQAFYGSFLLQSLVEQLTEKLGIPDLIVQVDVFDVRWCFRQGAVTVFHKIIWDYDMDSVQALSKIGRGVLNGSITPKEGLCLIRDHENKTNNNNNSSVLEAWYRVFPTRGLVLPLMAPTVAATFFGATWYDVGFATACGVVAGLVAWLGTLSEQLWGLMDYLAAIFTGLIATSAVGAFPESACFKAQVLGTVYWFLYGTAIVLALYELTNNQVIAGATRFMLALVRSYGLSFGALLGAWLAFYAGPDRLEDISIPCDTKDHQIGDIWLLLFFPLAAIACLLQFRVALRHFPVCFFVQTVGFGTQYLIGTWWNQPDFLANLIPAFFITLASHACLVLLQRWKLSSLEVSKHGYIQEKKRETDADPRSNNLSASSHHQLQSDNTIRDEESNHHHHPHHGLDDENDESIIGFVQSGWAHENVKAGYPQGYVQHDKLSYSRSDTWFCLLPALYLLVPGAKVFGAAFFHIASSAEGSSVESLATAFVTIAISQVIGLRLGFATIWLVRIVQQACSRS